MSIKTLIDCAMTSLMAFHIGHLNLVADIDEFSVGSSFLTGEKRSTGPLNV